MNSEDDARLRQLLARQQELQRLINMLRGNDASRDDLPTKRLNDNEDSDLIDSVGNDIAGELFLLRAAIQRLESGEFGQCMKCTKRIPDERLNAFAYATLCAECANQSGAESGELHYRA